MSELIIESSPPWLDLETSEAESELRMESSSLEVASLSSESEERFEPPSGERTEAMGCRLTIQEDGQLLFDRRPVVTYRWKSKTRERSPGHHEPLRCKCAQ